MISVSCYIQYSQWASMKSNGRPGAALASLPSLTLPFSPSLQIFLILVPKARRFSAFLGHVVLKRGSLQTKPSDSGDENGFFHLSLAPAFLTLVKIRSGLGLAELKFKRRKIFISVQSDCLQNLL